MKVDTSLDLKRRQVIMSNCVKIIKIANATVIPITKESLVHLLLNCEISVESVGTKTKRKKLKETLK